MKGIVAKKTEKRQSVTEIIDPLDPDMKLACPDWLIAELIREPVHRRFNAGGSAIDPVL